MVKWKKYFLLLVLPFLLTGCWDRKDPEDRVYMITIGVDGGGEKNHFTFAPANIGEEEAEIYGAEAATLAEAVAQTDCRSSRKTDLGQLRTIILGKKFLEDPKALASLLDELERSQAVSEKVMLLATEGKAEDCVKAVMKENNSTGLFLWDFYKNTAKEVAVTKALDLDTLLTERQQQAGAVVFPRIMAEEEKLRIGGGLAVGSRGVYPLSDEGERGYLFLLGEGEGALLEEKYDEVLPLQIVKSRVSYEFRQLENGHILCRINLPLEGALQGGGGGFLSLRERKNIENLFEGIIKKEVEHTIEIATDEAHEDLFGILPRLSRYAPSLAEGKNRQELWDRMEFEIVPELELKDMGRKR